MAIFPYLHKPVTSRINYRLHLTPIVLKEAILVHEWCKVATDSRPFSHFPIGSELTKIRVEELELLHTVAVTMCHRSSMGKSRTLWTHKNSLCAAFRWSLMTLPRAHRLESLGTLADSFLGSNFLVDSSSMGMNAKLCKLLE